MRPSYSDSDTHDTVNLSSHGAILFLNVTQGYNNALALQTTQDIMAQDQQTNGLLNAFNGDQ